MLDLRAQNRCYDRFSILIKDTVVLAEKISNLINNKEKRQFMGMTGRRRKKDKFDVRQRLRHREEDERKISRWIRSS